MHIVLTCRCLQSLCGMRMATELCNSRAAVRQPRAVTVNYLHLHYIYSTSSSHSVPLQYTIQSGSALCVCMYV